MIILAIAIPESIIHANIIIFSQCNNNINRNGIRI